MKRNSARNFSFPQKSRLENDSEFFGLEMTSELQI